MGSGSKPPNAHGPLLEAATWLLSSAGGELPITSLNKALFYLDLSALAEGGETITGATYLALPAGPVVAKYDRRIVQALEDAGLAQQDVADDGVTKPVCLLQEPKRHHLTEAQLAIAAQIGRWAKRESARSLSEYSHKNIGWKLAWHAGLGQAHPAQKVDLRIAMQQVMDRDPWLDEEPTSEVEQAFALADSEPGTAW